MRKTVRSLELQPAVQVCFKRVKYDLIRGPNDDSDRHTHDPTPLSRSSHTRVACDCSSTPLPTPDSFYTMQMIDAEKLRYCVENEISGENAIANAVLRIYLPEDVTFRYVGCFQA